MDDASGGDTQMLGSGNEPWMPDVRVDPGYEEADEVEEHDDDDGSIQDDDHRDEAVKRIEGTILSFLTQLSGLQSVDFDGMDDEAQSDRRAARKGQKLSRIVLQLANRRKTGTNGSTVLRNVQFPKSSRRGNVKTFAQLFRALDIMHKALVDEIRTTKRDIYYQDVPLFGTQSVVDRLVDDLAATFHFDRSDLNVRATSKGLVCGSALVIHLMGGDFIQVNDVEGTLIPAGEAVQEFSLVSSINWVLIVEKEAIFQTLCRLKLTAHADLPGPGIMITGKGYPDVATRQFVKTLEENIPASVPILALVDADPYGLDILSVYKYGSVAMRHENGRLAAGSIEWLGVWSSELTGLGISQDAMISMTNHDRVKAYAMLKREGMPSRWKKELVHMLHRGRKAEIEITYSIQSDTHDMGANQCGNVVQDHESSLARLMLHEPHPLLLYLARKVSYFVTSYSASS